MIAANWSNIKTSINNTYLELRREIHCQINQEIKRSYPAIPKAKKIFTGEVNNQAVQNKLTDDKNGSANQVMI